LEAEENKNNRGNGILIELLDRSAVSRNAAVDDEIEQELSKIPLLVGFSASAAIYMRNVIDAVLREDMHAALDEIFRLSNDEIPDEHAESYLLLAQNVCAVCEHVEGWVMFQKELVRFLLENRRAADASARLKDLLDIIPNDEEVIALKELVKDGRK